MVSLKLGLPLFLIALASTRWRMRGMATPSWRPGAEGRRAGLSEETRRIGVQRQHIEAVCVATNGSEP